jgi:hypothetical protein
LLTNEQFLLDKIAVSSIVHEQKLLMRETGVPHMVAKERHLGLTTKPSGSWVQVERAALERWAILASENPRAVSVMMVLVAQMGRHNAVVISQKNLARLAKCSRATLQRALDVLRKEYWIEARQIGQNGTVNAYIVNDRAAWIGNRDGRRYSLFSAAVLVSDDEQPDQAELEHLEPLERVPAMFTGEQQLPAGDGLPPPSQPALPGMEPDLPARKINEDLAD